MERKAQCIICKCGSVIAACLAPHCFDDKDWMKDVRRYSILGYRIETLNCNDFKFATCICEVKPLQNQIDLFSGSAKV